MQFLVESNHLLDTFQLIMENFWCALAIHLHDNSILGTWKLTFENNTIVVYV